MKKFNISTFIKIGLLALAAVLSFTLLSNKFTNPETYKGIIEYLDAKKMLLQTLQEVQLQHLPQ